MSSPAKDKDAAGILCGFIRQYLAPDRFDIRKRNSEEEIPSAA